MSASIRSFPANPLDFPRIRAKNAINHIALNLGGAGQTPTQWQLSTYPAWAQPNIELIWEGVDLDICSPDPAVRKKTLQIGDMTIRPTDKLVTYVSRDLEPYRGFHIMMRALPDLMRARKDIKVVMIGGDGISYGAAPHQGGNWREVMLAEVGKRHRPEPRRVSRTGRLRHLSAALRRSDAHVYLTYPFVASWSMREAMAIGCPVIGGDTEPVREFITHGENGLLTPFLKPKTLAHTDPRAAGGQGADPHAARERPGLCRTAAGDGGLPGPLLRGDRAPDRRKSRLPQCRP